MPYQISPNGSVGECLSSYAILGRHKTFTLKYGGKVFRVNPKLYKVVRKPLYNRDWDLRRVD